MSTSTHTMNSPEPYEPAKGARCERRRLIAGLLSVWLALSPLITLRAAYAGSIADAGAPATARPQVTATSSGVPLVNIAAPNASGTSYTRYQRFDVDPVGLILNNSTRTASSQLGGQIAANPNFSGRSASLIVNEVTSAIPSQLNGPLAVFGDPAKLVIANPNGVTCNGCGFLNTPWVQLTTGRVQFLTAPGGAITTPENGAALAFDVRGGTIRIEGQGLASPLARLDLIAQTLNINGPVSVSGALNLLAGRQLVAADDLTVSANGTTNTRSAIQADDASATDFAVDATVLGAMTAGQIRIVATPAGMGVRTDGRLAATAGDLLISADGEMRLRQATATRDVAIVASGSLSNSEQLAAARDLNVSAGSIDNRHARISANGDAVLTAAMFDNTGGTIQTAGQLDFVLPGAIVDLSAAATGTLAGGTGLALDARQIANSGDFRHGAALSLTASQSITNSGTLTAGGDFTLAAADAIDNSGVIQSLGKLFLAATRASNTSGARMESGSDLSLSFAGLDNRGDLIGRRDLIASITSLTNAGVMQAGNDAVFDLGAASNNAGGTLVAARDVDLHTESSGSLGGMVGAGRNLYLHFNDYTHGNETDFRAGNDLAVTAANFTNHGLLEAPGSLAIAATDTLSNSGQLLARNDIALSVGGSFTNSAGVVEAGRDLAINTVSLTNGGNSVVTEYVAYSLAGYVHNVLTYVTDPLAQLKLFNEAAPDWFWKNSRVTLNNRYSLYLDSGLDAPIFYLTLTRPGDPGVLSAGRDLSVNASGTVTNQASILTAGRDVTISAARFDNLAGQTVDYGNVWAGGGSHQLKAFGNASATVQAAGNVTITAGSQSNTGLIQGSSVYLGGSLSNGITDYMVATPAPRLPDAVVNLGNQNLPVGAVFTPNAPTLFSSAARLALIAPISPDTLNALLPPELRAGGIPYLLDGWLEQQALRQAALNQTGRVLFLAGLDTEEGQSPEARQRQLLYAAAARFAQAEGTRLGVALSAEQIARLSEPILWYVQETVTGPDGNTYTALVPRLYLPEATRGALGNLGGGTIRGNDVALNAPPLPRGEGRGEGAAIVHTGFIQANRLTVQADTLVNEKRSAYWGRGTENVKGGYIEYWGDRVQPGGFIAAAEMQLNVNKVFSVSGEFYAVGREVSPDLARQFGNRYTRQENQDHSFSEFHADDSAGLKQVAVMGAAIAVSYFTAGATSGLLAAEGGSAFAAGTIGNAVVSAAAGGMASSAVTGALSGNFDLNSVLKSGLTSGLTAGLTQWAGQALNNATLTTTDQVGGVLKTGQTATELTDKLIGYTVRAGLSASVNQAVYGKQSGSFGDAFVNSFAASASADAAKFIGDNTGAGKALGEMASASHVLAHAALGCAAAALGGKDCASGAIGGATSALIGSLLPDPQGQGERALMAGALTFAGGAMAQVAGYDGVTAAQAAQNEALNNRLLHRNETLALQRLQEGNSAEERQRLADAACALAHCAAGVSDSDPKKAELLAKEARGQTYTLELTQLKSTGLFQYSERDSINDALLRNDEIIQRAAGGAKLIAGGAGVVGGAGIAAAGATGCAPTLGASCLAVPAGAAVTALSYGEAKEGSSQLLGPYQSQEGRRVLDSFNVATYPSDRDRLTELGVDAATAAFMLATARFGGNLLNKAEGVLFGKGVVGTEANAVTGRQVAAKGASFFDDLASQAARNPDSNKVVLGKFLEDGKSYTKVAAHYEATYLKLENWRELSRSLSSEEMWRINEAFIDQQIRAGKEIVLSHDPTRATGFYKRELSYLGELGYQFVRDGWVWRAVR